MEELKIKAERLNKEIKNKQKELRKVYKQMELEEKVKYEGIIIFRADTTLKQLELSINSFKNIIKITNVEHLGLRKLAYVTRGCATGYYFKYEFISNKVGIEKLEKDLKNNKDIIKFLEIKLED